MLAFWQDNKKFILQSKLKSLLNVLAVITISKTLKKDK